MRSGTQSDRSLLLLDGNRRIADRFARRIRVGETSSSGRGSDPSGSGPGSVLVRSGSEIALGWSRIFAERAARSISAWPGSFGNSCWVAPAMRQHPGTRTFRSGRSGRELCSPEFSPAALEKEALRSWSLLCGLSTANGLWSSVVVGADEGERGTALKRAGAIGQRRSCSRTPGVPVGWNKPTRVSEGVNP